jgi:hypothetical protein
MPRGEPREVTTNVGCPRKIKKIKTLTKVGQYDVDETTRFRLGHESQYTAH